MSSSRFGTKNTRRADTPPSLVLASKQSLRAKVSTVFTRPFSRGPRDNPTPPPSRGNSQSDDPTQDLHRVPFPTSLNTSVSDLHDDSSEALNFGSAGKWPDDPGRRWPRAPFLCPKAPDALSMHVRMEVRNTPSDRPQIPIRSKDDYIQQRVQECAFNARMNLDYHDEWMTYMQNYSGGCFNISNLPHEPFLNEDFLYLLAPYPANELTRQAAAEAVCTINYTDAKVESVKAFLQASMLQIGTEIYTVSTFDEVHEIFHFSHGTRGWPNVDSNERINSMAAHALMTTDVMVVLDTDLDWRFQNNALVSSGPQVRFLVAAPMLAPSGEAVAILSFYSQYPREVFTFQERRQIRQTCEILYDLLWSSFEGEQTPAAAPGVTSIPRPFSTSDLTSVHQNPGHSTPEPEATENPAICDLDVGLLREKIYENMPDSPTLGSAAHVALRSVQRALGSSDMDDVPLFLDRYGRDPHRISIRTVSTNLTYLEPKDDHDVTEPNTILKQYAESTQTKFDALYLVRLVPYRLGLSDETLVEGGMEMKLLASYGVKPHDELDIPMHLRALRSKDDGKDAAIIWENLGDKCYSKGFLIPMRVNDAEDKDKRSEGVVFAGFTSGQEVNEKGRRGKAQATKKILEEMKETLSCHEIASLIKLGLNVYRLISFPTVPGESKGTSSRYPANEAVELDLDRSALASSLCASNTLPYPTAASSSRYPANEAVEVNFSSTAHTRCGSYTSYYSDDVSRHSNRRYSAYAASDYSCMEHRAIEAIDQYISHKGTSRDLSRYLGLNLSDRSV